MRASLFLGVALVACGAACGGSGSSDDLFSGGGSRGTATGTPTGTATGNPPTAPPATGTSVPPVPPSPPCAGTKYYRDRDGDGFGSITETKTSCTSPGDEWITKGGDCNDEEADVFPGQTAYFTVSYQQNGKHSFDYDCSGDEDQSLPARKAASTCALGLTPGTCTGSGYLPPDPARPSGTGVDPLCGAARYQNCKFLQGNGTACQAVVSNDVLPTSCR